MTFDTHWPIPGPDPGACPECGGWLQAGMAHDCTIERDHQKTQASELLRALAGVTDTGEVNELEAGKHSGTPDGPGGTAQPDPRNHPVSSGEGVPSGSLTSHAEEDSERGALARHLAYWERELPGVTDTREQAEAGCTEVTT